MNSNESSSEAVQNLLLYKNNRAKLLQKIDSISLPEEVSETAMNYKKLIGKRPDFLWKWLHYCSHLLEFPSVQDTLEKDVLFAKNLINMINVILDDIADVQKDGLLILFIQSVLFYPANPDFNQLNSFQKSQAEFCFSLWKSFHSIVDKFPNYLIIDPIFRYDMMQMVNGKYWSFVASSKPMMFNVRESWTYSPHSMNSMLHLCIDVMASSAADFQEKLHSEFGKLREIYLISNEMAHIANSLATWQREMEERDFTGILFAVALERKLLSQQELRDLPSQELVEKLRNSNFEQVVLSEWIIRKQQLVESGKSLKSINIEDFAFKNEQFLELHLACRTKL